MSSWSAGTSSGRAARMRMRLEVAASRTTMAICGMSQPAVLLGASDIHRLLDHRELLDQLRIAMCAYATSGIPARRAHSPIPGAAPHSVMIVFPGLVPGIPAYTVKINAKLPTSRPSVRGLIALVALDTGELLAVMDSIKITEVRTALVGALAAQALARSSVDTIAAIGADEPGKAELDADLIGGSRFVCDDPDLAVEMGALAGVGLGRDAIHASLGEVLSGTASGRSSDDEITIFGSVGLPCQDLPAAWMAFRKAQ